jgi:hypothetical protein
MDAHRYWDRFHGQFPDVHEWYASTDDSADRVCSLLQGLGVRRCTVLHVGCGTSLLGHRIAAATESFVVNADFSAVGVRALVEASGGAAGADCSVMDARALPLRCDSVDCVVDKGASCACACVLRAHECACLCTYMSVCVMYACVW